MPRSEVAPGVWLDGRLALFHQADRWLAVADTHYGYSGVMRQAGGLFPLWGDADISSRLAALCRDYEPQTLIIAGDLVHGRVNRQHLASFLDELAVLAPRLVLIRGNHDRSPTVRDAPFEDAYQCPGFFFHHGHLDLSPPTGSVEVTGHLHPAVSLRDGAGLSLKMPAFIQEPRRWILPAFSPWAGGTHWEAPGPGAARRWICSPKHVFEWTG